MRGLKYIYLLFALVFGGVGFGFLFGMILPEYSEAAVARDGEIYYAEVTGFNSNLTVDGMDYYRLFFVWSDESGTHQGQTNAAYTHREAYEIYESGEPFEIKVLNGRAVAADFRMSEGSGFMWVFVIAFGAVGMGMGAAFIFLLLRDIRNNAIMVHGTDGVGNFIGHSIGMFFNHTPCYKLTFSFIDNSAQKHIVNTGTIFAEHEINALRSMGIFPVRYRGTHAVVLREAIRYDGAPRTSFDDAAPQYGGDVNNAESAKGYSGSAAPLSPVAKTDAQTYNRILDEIERQRTYNEMLDVLDKHSSTLNSKDYYRLKDEVEKIRERRKLY